MYLKDRMKLQIRLDYGSLTNLFLREVLNRTTSMALYTINLQFELDDAEQTAALSAHSLI